MFVLLKVSNFFKLIPSFYLIEVVYDQDFVVDKKPSPAAASPGPDVDDWSEAFITCIPVSVSPSRLIVTRSHGEVNYKETSDPTYFQRNCSHRMCIIKRTITSLHCFHVMPSTGSSSFLGSSESKKVLRCDNLKGGFVQVFTADKSNNRHTIELDELWASGMQRNFYLLLFFILPLFSSNLLQISLQVQ